MILKHKFNCLDGDIDTKELKLISIPSKESYADVAMKVENGSFGLLTIKLSSGLTGKRETFTDAIKFAEELCRRWNKCETKL